MLTNQQIYDKVAPHMLMQGKRASIIGTDGSMICQYRTAEGLTCAVGCLFDQSIDTEAVEGKTVTAVRLALDPTNEQYVNPATKALREALDKVGVSIDSYPLLEKLQQIHDGINPSDWERQLFNAALEFNLSTAVLGITPSQQ